jgi:hypothetical protein
VHLRAKGSFVPVTAGGTNDAGSFFTTTTTKKKPKSLQERLLLGGPGALFLSDDPKLRTTPDAFHVTISSASIHLWGVSLSLPIRGSSQLVVLYADSRIRIFVSPLGSSSSNRRKAGSSSSSMGAGSWESSGLIAVQIRSDLVTGGDPMDLR